MRIAFCVAVAWTAAIAGLIALANEVGRFCEDTNPYHGIPAAEEEPVKKDCYGCMGATFGDCDRCREHKEE